MKRGILFLVLILVLSVPMMGFGQSMGFGVKMGPFMQTAQFMLPMGSIQPFAGVDYIGFSANAEMEGSELDASISMFIPHAGLKFFLGTGQTKPYIFGNFYKAFASFTIEADGQPMLDEATEDFLKEFLGFWGIKAGLGAEYQVSDHFSIGGEWGLNLTKMSGALEDADLMAMGMEGLTTDIKAALKASYVAFVLNFYF
jgi:hypothetical protein